MSNASKSSAPIAGPDPKQPGRQYKILASDFTQAPSSEPFPWFAGRVRHAGGFVTPIFKLRAVSVTTTAGK